MAYSAYDELLQRRLLEHGGAAGSGGSSQPQITPAGGGSSGPQMPSGIGGLLGRLFNGGGSSGPFSGGTKAQYAPEGEPAPDGGGGGFLGSNFGNKLMDFSMGAAFGRNPNESFQYGLQGLYQGIGNRRADKKAQAELNRTRQVAIAMGVPEEIAMNAPPEVLINVIKEATAAGLKPITLSKGQKAFDAKGGQIADNPEVPGMISTDNPIYNPQTGEWITPPGYTPGGKDRAVKEKILLSPDGKTQKFFDLNDTRPVTESLTGQAAAVDALQRGWVDPSALRNEGEGREFTQENLLRNAYLKQAEPFANLAQNYRRILASSQDNTGASDVALIFSFMKMLDPTSVVRETEYATAQNTGSIPERVWMMFNKAKTGEQLDPAVRAKFVQQAQRQMEQQWQSYDALRKQWEGIVGQYNLDPTRVLPDVSYGLERVAPDDKKAEGTGDAPAQAAQPTIRKFNPETGEIE